MANLSNEPTDFIIFKKEIHVAQFAPAPKPEETPLKPGQVRFRLGTFAFTANNVTYAAFGEAMSYWKFFPVTKEGYGRVPVWGFADVVESRNEAVKVGQRFYGYFPISTYLTIDAGRVTGSTLVDAAAHRADLPPVYNQYVRVDSDPAHSREKEGISAIFRPLFVTSFLLDDSFAEKDYFGAKQIILSSASSKTALGMAYLMSKSRKGKVEIVGLTSARNLGFTKDLGYYDRVVSYDDIAKLDATKPAVFIDFSGDARIVRAVHTHFGDTLKYSSQVGATHWEEIAQPHDLPGPKPVLFFAPDHARRRLQVWGSAEFQSRTTAALNDFIAAAGKWICIVEGRGPKAVEAAYHAVLNGEASPAEGHVLSL